MKFAAACLLLLLTFNKLSAQAEFNQSVLNIMQAQTQAWNKGNIAEFMQGYWNSDSLLFVGKNGPVYGYTTTLENYKKNYPDTVVMGKLQFNLLSIQQISPTHGFVLGKFLLTRKIGNASGYFTLWLRKINGKWLIIADHTS
ncbi:MAG: nuclear transport factor 2 family protein [Chitinophagia bacterium]|nr:nuclear transport factor 2 family protein [Chitinophagia bacterium]